MHKRSPLSIDQIEQLKIELNKMQETNLTSFAQKFSSSLTLPNNLQFDSLYQFSLRQHQRLAKELENVLQFASSILSNFQALWEQVYFRDTKLSQLRQLFASATVYIQQLKQQNYELKKLMTQAETYIEQIQQQKQYLDAMYQDRSSSTTTHSTKKISMSRCVSESSLRWSRSRVKDTFNFEKLKDYIDRLKEERNQYQSQLVNLSKRYQIKCQQSKKANLFIQHLINRLNHRHQLRQYIDITNLSMNLQKDNKATDFNTDDILQMLQKNQYPSSTSLKNLFKLQTENLQRKQDYCHENSPFNNMIPSLKEFNNSQSGINHHKQTKDAQIYTESQLLRCQTAQTQTQNKENKSKQKKIDYNISIYITGQESQDINLQNFLKDLQLQKKIQANIKTKIQKTDKQKACEKKEVKAQNKNSRIGQILEYYHQRWVSNRIKKYSFQKPNKATYKLYKK